MSPRELAVNFTDTKASFVSEASVYRLLKDHGLIASPAFILMKAADRFANPTTAPNQLWQTDFTYLKRSKRLGAVVGLAKRSAAFIRMKAGLAMNHDLSEADKRWLPTQSWPWCR